MDEKTSDVTNTDGNSPDGAPQPLMSAKKKLKPLNDITQRTIDAPTPTEAPRSDEGLADESAPAQPLDPAVVQLERDEALKKLIDSKKYRVKIKEPSLINRRALSVIVIVLALGLAFFLLIDNEIVGS